MDEFYWMVETEGCTFTFPGHDEDGVTRCHDRLVAGHSEPLVYLHRIAS